MKPLKEKHRKWIEKCEYCGGAPELQNSSVIYGKDYGNIYLCPDCGAFVGCHGQSNIPLGRLADKDTKELRKLAHGLFDPLWKNRDLDPDKSCRQNRKLAYRRMAELLDIPIEDAHISQISFDDLKKLIRSLCKRKGVGIPESHKKYFFPQ